MLGQGERATSSGSPLAVGALGLVVLLLASAQEAPAQERSTYRRAVKAIESGHWAAAATLLREAISDDPKERQRRFVKPYLPHYYLGVALFEMRNCQGAQAAFAESEGQGAVVRTRVMPDLVSRRSLCKARRRAQSELHRGRDLADSIAQLRHQLRSNPQVWQSGSPSLADRERQALAKLQAAGRLLGSAAAWEDHARIEQARGTALSAVEDLRTMITTATRRAKEIPITEKRDKLLGLMTQAKDQLVARKIDRPSAEFSAARQELLDLIGEVGATVDDSVEELEGLIERFTGALARFDRVTKAAGSPPPVPADLLRAAEHYFSAAYEDVLGMLDSVSFDDSHADAHALLFQAAARFALFVLAGGQDSMLLEQAREDLRDLKQIDPSLTPLATAFSPRFIQFFENPEGAQPGAPAASPK